MKGQRFHRILVWLGSILFLLACALPSFGVSSPTQEPQSLAPELLGTPVAQTAIAAQTQTAIYMPPSLTPTLTPFPTGTLITLSSTPTFFFALPTFTPLPTWTSTPGIVVQRPGSGNSSADNNNDSPFTDKEWTCAIRAKSPSMGTVMAQEASFYVSITLMNSGTKTWTNNGVDFVYKSGLRNEGRRIQDLPSTVAPGEEITLTSQLVAPKKPGTYSTVWNLKVGNTSFCGVKYSFEVK